MIKKILHTSDWHIGRRLKNHERYVEFQKFFQWLEEIIKSENIDALLVAGDIFDNTTPGVKAQDIYYSFLGRIAKSNCRHVIIISGNHDSPAFLDAPKDLLKLFKIHVIGQACENPEDEVITLADEFNNPELIVCAVPYLRDRDVTVMTGSESYEKNITAGIKDHYEKVFARALKVRGDSKIPVIAMGHLFAQGGKVNADGGERSLYVGTAVEVKSSIFPDFLAYTALGHIHSPQIISRENIRYSGSPIAMGFGEAGTKKAVYVLESDGEKISGISGIKEISVPVFQRLERIDGNMDEIFQAIDFLGLQQKSIWLDIAYTGEESPGALQEKIYEHIKNFPLLEILSLRDESKTSAENLDSKISKNLEDIKPLEMLELCFNKNNIPDEQREIFIPMYQEILRDVNADF